MTEPITQYARDREYDFPEYRKISKIIFKIFKETTKANLNVVKGHKHYRDGIGFSRNWEYPWAIINSKVSKDMKVLDVGCGRAPFLFYLGSVIKCETHGVDSGDRGPIEDGLWGCDEGHNKKYNFTVKKADVREKLPYPDNSFDRVFCISVIEHMKDGDKVKKAVKEMVRVLKKNGLLVITAIDGIHQKEIEEAAGIPYYGECDFSRPDRRGPYQVLGMIFVKGKEKKEEEPEIAALYENGKTPTDEMVTEAKKQVEERKAKEEKKTEEEKEKDSPIPPQKEKEEMDKLETEAGKGELPIEKLTRLEELKKKLKKKSIRSLRERLVAINGLSDKCADEILEEYKTLENIKKAIKEKTFSVGAVGPEKQSKIMKLRC